ncbi:hypothetical protein [Pedobacter sp. MR2016-24]|uniref:hypothetical protein n=1 Tax=Pedobacter sp. MR2016-24 TaxID=2994466 RepID=UPI002246DACA|nr:hypothetical protein [Pedobacter sp. MR2016-24]MCX2484059.1 hypothetical protein [Pedobacter sp. MR2016-24]
MKMIAYLTSRKHVPIGTGLMYFVKTAMMPFIPDPRFSTIDEKQFTAQKNIQEE